MSDPRFFGTSYNTFELKHVTTYSESDRKKTLIDQANGVKHLISQSDVTQFINEQETNAKEASSRFLKVLTDKRDAMLNNVPTHPCYTYSTLISLGALLGGVAGTGLSAILSGAAVLIDESLEYEKTFLLLTAIWSSLGGFGGRLFGYKLADQTVGEDMHTPYKGHLKDMETLNSTIAEFNKMVEPEPPSKRPFC